jgi:hypothetical protein
VTGPYREPPEVPPCAQHGIVMVLDEEGGAEVWCPVCEKLWWSGTKRAWDMYVMWYRVIREARGVAVDNVSDT